ncbi:MAG: tRNA pseudouridine(38-40) synthase TruA, partial [Rubrobacteraceae bacterium]
MKLAGLVEYDGADFAGWAIQPDKRTVERELSRALETILRHPVKMSVAGRTDAGVHASGQVISFETGTKLSPDLIAYKTTAVLPKDVALRRCAEVPDSFDARRSAKSRSYEYRIVNADVRSPLRRRQEIHIARKLDLDLLQRVAGLVSGVHDFRSFTPTKTRHARFERTVTESRWERRGELLIYRITANSFLYGMVRALVGTMIEVADGSRSVDSFEGLLSGGERKDAGPSAPGRGLALVGVGYDCSEVSGFGLQVSGKSCGGALMNDELLGRIDSYIEGLFVEADPVLESAIEDSKKAGLPGIQVSPNQGKFLQLLAELVGARRILEIGTLGGYSGIHFARALPDDGTLISLELDERHAEVARENIERAGLSEKVEIRVGDAKELLRGMGGEGPFDLV